MKQTLSYELVDGDPNLISLKSIERFGSRIEAERRLYRETLRLNMICNAHDEGDGTFSVIIITGKDRAKEVAAALH